MYVYVLSTCLGSLAKVYGFARHFISLTHTHSFNQSAASPASLLHHSHNYTIIASQFSDQVMVFIEQFDSTNEYNSKKIYIPFSVVCTTVYCSEVLSLTITILLQQGMYKNCSDFELLSNSELYSTTCSLTPTVIAYCSCYILQLSDSTHEHTANPKRELNWWYNRTEHCAAGLLT